MSEEYHRGYRDGVLDERKQHKLQTWHEMPDEEGWYWFKGITYPEPRRQDDGFNIDSPYVVTVHEPDDYGTPCWHMMIDGELKVIEATGTWRGPIPNPFEVTP